MTAPKRIQLRRTKGWRKPDEVINVARPTKWGNPFRVADCIENGFADTTEQARIVCVDAFRDWLSGDRWADGSGSDADRRHAAYVAAIPELAGHDLACWCPLDQPCHADVLLDLANDGSLARSANPSTLAPTKDTRR